MSAVSGTIMKRKSFMSQKQYKPVIRHIKALNRCFFVLSNYSDGYEPYILLFIMSLQNGNLHKSKIIIEISLISRLLLL